MNAQVFDADKRVSMRFGENVRTRLVSCGLTGPFRSKKHMTILKTNFKDRSKASYVQPNVSIPYTSRSVVR